MCPKNRSSGKNDNHLETNEEDVIEKCIGAFGKYQCRILCLICLAKVFMAWQLLGIVFLAPNVSYSCLNSSQLCPCSHPVYDTSTFSRTMISEWDLICDRTWMISMSQMFSHLGSLIGSVVFGMLSDRFGRRYPIIVAVTMMLASGILASFMQDFWAFTFMRFVTGLATGGVMVTSFVIVMEIVGQTYRDITTCFYHFCFNIGHLVMPAFGYFFADYKKFQLAVSIPSVVLLTYILFMPESPRWLLLVGRTEEAIQMLEKIAKVNGSDSTLDIRMVCFNVQKKQKNDQAEAKGTIIDILKSNNMRKSIICISFNWLVVSYGYYGVSQYVGQLSGNVFVNVSISALFNVFGSLILIPLMNTAGRKTLVIGANLITAFCLLAIPIVPEGIIAVILASTGIVSTLICFSIAYVYSVELFPTAVRNVALGISSMMARVGSMLAPFVVGLNVVAAWLPPVMFGLMPLLASLLCIIIPETKGRHLMTTLNEGELFGRPMNVKSSDAKVDNINE